MDFRYRQTEMYKRCLSGRMEIEYQLRVELEVVRVLCELGQCSKAKVEEVEKAISKVTAEEVYAEENRIKHNIRALVNCIQRLVRPRTRPLIHRGMTSFDIIDTANAMRIRDAIQLFLLPSLITLEETLIKIARREADTVQMGRTHGQHAVPITFGFAIAEYVSRLGGRISLLHRLAGQATGKISGAVGAYNATCLLFDDPVAFEAKVLNRLGLRQLDYSTQIVQAEWMCDIMCAITSTMGVLANLADDMRNLQRTEIGEIGEAFAVNQVGSSTMTHKRNPINFENIKSFWKAYMPRIITVFMDQISEHQRDLTNSASSRFNPETLAGLAEMAKRANKVMGSLAVDHDRMSDNVSRFGDRTMGEIMYIALAAVGHPDAHEAVRLLTVKLDNDPTETMVNLFWSEPSLKSYRNKLSPKQRGQLLSFCSYTGLSSQRAHAVCHNWEPLMIEISGELGRIAQMSKTA